MNTSLKNLLGLLLAGAIIIGSYVLFQIAHIYDRSSEPTNFRSFSVSADAKTTGVPDIATFSFQVISEGGMDVAALQKENALKMNKAIEYIKSQKIDAKDIKTEQYSVSPRYTSVVCDYSVKGEPCNSETKINGYTISQSVVVKVRDFNTISNLLSGVVDNGANSVSQIQFAIDDPTSLENIARAEAIKKAQKKAQDIARAGGFELGRLLEINESTG